MKNETVDIYLLLQRFRPCREEDVGLIFTLGFNNLGHNQLDTLYVSIFYKGREILKETTKISSQPVE